MNANATNATNAQNELSIKPIDFNFPDNPFKLELIHKDYEEDVKSMTCPICINLVWKPVHCSECTNLVCSQCMEQWLTKSKNCPLCNKVFKSNPVVNLVKSALSKIKSKCYFSSELNQSMNEGCDKLIGYYDFEKHIKGECDYYPYSCTRQNCRVTGPKFKMLTEHQNNCDYYCLECSYCRKQISKRLLISHESMCEYRTVLCQICNLNIRENVYAKHKENVKECISLIKNEYKNVLDQKNLEVEFLKRENEILRNNTKSISSYNDLINEKIQLENKARLLEEKLESVLNKQKNETNDVRLIKEQFEQREKLILSLKEELKKYEVDRQKLIQMLDTERKKTAELENKNRPFNGQRPHEQPKSHNSDPFSVLFNAFK